MTVPVKIEKYSDLEMKIEWSNKQTTIIPFSKIRFHCRCAECVDEWTRKRRIVRSQIQPDVHPVSVAPVGRYAIQIDWSDGHKTGIYTFPLLYSIATDTNPDLSPEFSVQTEEPSLHEQH